MRDPIGQVKIDRSAIDPETISAARSAGTPVVIMPLRYQKERGVYAQSSLTLVKHLREAGIDAKFLDPPERRTFEVKKGVLESAVATVILGIISTAAWDAVKEFFRSKKPDKLSVTYVDLENDEGQHKTAWKVDGDSEAVLDAIDKLRRGESNSNHAKNALSTVEDSRSTDFRFVAAGSDEDLRAAYHRERIEGYRTSGQDLMKSAHQVVEQSGDEPSRNQAERNARQALGFFARSLDWAEDSDQEDEAHRLMDEAGAWVRQTFGCSLARSGTEYRQRCPVALAHNRIGMSVGGTAVRICSLCGDDVSECAHLPGTAYMVPGGNSPLGWCRVCLKESCDHQPTQQYRVSVIAMIKDMDVHEISLVLKPAHPEARILEMSVPVSDLREVLGAEFAPGSEVSCDRCLQPCNGLVKHDQQ